MDSPPHPPTPALLLWGVPELRTPAPVRLGAERRHQLLVLLALAGGQWVERDRVAALLWPEATLPDARRNLRKVLFKAHALVGDGALQAGPQALRWAVATDTAAFEATRHHDAAGALAWRRGPPLQGLDDPRNNAWCDWLAAERARLDRDWLATAHAHLQAQATPEARAAVARQVLDVDPLDETAVAALVQAETAAGRPAQAQAAYRRYAAQLAQELGVEPAHALRDLLLPTAPSALAAARDAATDVTQLATGEPDDRFIGRRSELAELQALLSDPTCRLLTVLGPGGIGKSSLARQALTRIGSLFPAGVAWVPLHDAPAASDLPARVAQALGVKLGDSTDALLDLLRGWLGGAGRGLVVLDNTEHLTALAPRLQALLGALPGLSLLLTSRTRMPAAGEWVLPLQGLALPDEDSRDLDAAASFDAVRLFECRARAARRSFTLAAHLPAVLAVCDALGGMPLAIELAASWVRLLPPETIAADLAPDALQALDLLERDPAAPSSPARAEHASLRAVLQGSWRLLGAREQQALAGLAVFEGGFTRGAAQAVVGCPLPLLSALADASLLAVDTEAGRFSMHPVVQRFARERLAEDEARRGDLAQRHAAHFEQLLAGWTPLVRAQPQQLVRQMLVEEANARAAWRHALGAVQPARLLQMLPAWRGLFETSGRFDEGLSMLRTLLQLPETDAATTRLLAHVRQVMCALLYQRGHATESLQLAQAGIDSALRCGERMPLKGCLNTAALALYLLGRPADALTYSQRMRAECEADGDRYGIVVALSSGAIALSSLGRFEAALADLQPALAIALELGNPGQIGHLYNIIGNHQRALAQWHEARASLEAGLRCAQQHGLAAGVSFCSVNLALVEIELGEIEPARQRLTTLMQRLEQVPQQQVVLDAELGLARIHIRLGQRQACLQGLQRVEALARASAQVNRRLQALQVWAEALLHEGRRGEALPLMQWLSEHPGLDMADRAALRRLLGATGAAPASRWTLHLETTVAQMLADSA